MLGPFIVVSGAFQARLGPSMDIGSTSRAVIVTDTSAPQTVIEHLGLQATKGEDVGIGTGKPPGTEGTTRTRTLQSTRPLCTGVGTGRVCGLWVDPRVLVEPWVLCGVGGDTLTLRYTRKRSGS